MNSAHVSTVPLAWLTIFCFFSGDFHNKDFLWPVGECHACPVVCSVLWMGTRMSFCGVVDSTPQASFRGVVDSACGNAREHIMNSLAQTQFCLYLLDAASSTETTLTNSIQIGRVQIRCSQILMRATPSYWSCGCTKVSCHIQTIKAGNAEKSTWRLKW